MKKKILKILLENNVIADKEALNFIISKRDPILYLNEILSKKKLPLFLSLQELQKIEKKKVEKIKYFEKKIQKKDEKKIINNINILKDITAESTTEGKIEDFKKYFNDRYITLKKFVKRKPEMIGSIPISAVKMHSREEIIKIIGIVSLKRKTQKGNIMLELEDENEKITCFISSNSDAFSENILVDEIIGAIGKKATFSNQRDQYFLSIEKIARPEIPTQRKVNKSQISEYVAFISDIHIGSSTFLKEYWKKFLNWLNEKNEISKKIKYLIVVGDNVDGIGIYPNQEEELDIFDIYTQYEALAKEFEKIPDDINIILLPGNHDAIRPAEPQPALPEQIQELFNSNILFVGNPCYFNINGVEILAYHGRSMDDYITHVKRLNYSNPIEIMKEMLKRRHLATIYGARTPIAPEKKIIWLLIAYLTFL